MGRVRVGGRLVFASEILKTPRGEVPAKMLASAGQRRSHSGASRPAGSVFTVRYARKQSSDADPGARLGFTLFLPVPSLCPGEIRLNTTHLGFLTCILEMIIDGFKNSIS